MKLALSMLCENPRRKTGLTSTYHEFVGRSLTISEELSWVVFVGPNQDWHVSDPRVEVVRRFPANDRLYPRLLADHLRVPPAARARGADLLITTGFVPLRKSLPVVMNVFSLQHLDRKNRVGLFREGYRSWVTRSWPRADLVITNSRFAVSQILGLFPELRDRLIQSYEGLQHEEYNTNVQPDEAARLKMELGLDPGYFLWVSNFYPYKQADLLLAGYGQLDISFRKKHPLVMVGGEWDGYRVKAQQQANAMGLGEDVKFFGWVGDKLLAPLYRQAMAHVLPSREETFGRTVIESMACGTAVVVNDIPIMHEVTANQAIIVNFNDTAAVTGALARIARDDAARAKLRAGGLARAQDFTFEKLTGERIAAMRRLVSARRAGRDFKV
jgi:glycosyltransferase involved in cell wall biosynthesis